MSNKSLCYIPKITKNASHRIPAKRGVDTEKCGFRPWSRGALRYTQSIHVTHVHWTIVSLKALD
jgi:hypothetical protein